MNIYIRTFNRAETMTPQESLGNLEMSPLQDNVGVLIVLLYYLYYYYCVVYFSLINANTLQFIHMMTCNSMIAIKYVVVLQISRDDQDTN